jgi:hypothetical protein
MGELITFPTKEKTCYDCIHAAFTGSGGTFCMEFREVILSEKLAAEDCDAFERE